MAPLHIVLLVAGILLVQVLLWVPILRWLRRRTREKADSLRDELISAGERAIRGPDPAAYRGASGGGFPRVKGSAVVALTDRRLAFRMVLGPDFDIRVDQIVDVRENKWFRRSYASGRMQIIVKTAEGAEVGFMAADHAAWMEALRALARDRWPGPAARA